jgi:ubiquinone biosynthesis protein
MMTVEGVARRIWPDHDIWAAADPVVRRWMTRELSPPARVKRFAEEAHQALKNIARMLETPPGPAPAAEVAQDDPPMASRLLWFALGAALAGGAFLAAALWFR